MKSIFPILLLLGFASCAHLADNPTRADEADDIGEAVFRFQIQKADPANPKLYFLEVGEKQDPSDAFMTRFEGHTPPVRKYSECTGYNIRGVFDKKTNEKGKILRIDKISWRWNSTVRVEGGMYSAGLGASGNTYILEKQEGEWKVIKAKTNWVS